MSKGWNIVLLGAPGAVGRALLALLAQRQFPVGELYLLANEHNVGEKIRFVGKTLSVKDAADFDWSQAQLAFFVAGSEASARYAEDAAEAGCLVIDSSKQFALEPDVPLVVADVNAHVLAEYRNRNIITVADNLTSQLLCAIKPLVDQASLHRLHVTNLLPASASGKAAVEALAAESARLLSGLSAESFYFGRQLAFNMLPLMADREGSVVQERRLVEQVRKVMQDENLPISVSCLQSPVFYGNAQLVCLEGAIPLSAEAARNELMHTEDILLMDENDFPTQVTDASDSTLLSLGCFRNDYGLPALLQFWSVADNIGFGGALMAIKTAERLVQEHLY